MLDAIRRFNGSRAARRMKKLELSAHRPDSALYPTEIEDVIFFLNEGVAGSPNKPNAIMTAKGGSKATHNGKCEAAIPDNPAPATNADHTLASI